MEQRIITDAAAVIRLREGLGPLPISGWFLSDITVFPHEISLITLILLAARGGPPSTPKTANRGGGGGAPPQWSVRGPPSP